MTVVLSSSAGFCLVDIAPECAIVGCTMHFIQPAICDDGGKVPDIDVTHETLPTVARPGRGTMPERRSPPSEYRRAIGTDT
jgi:hypothetical protein